MRDFLAARLARKRTEEHSPEFEDLPIASVRRVPRGDGVAKPQSRGLALGARETEYPPSWSISRPTQWHVVVLVRHGVRMGFEAMVS